MSQFLRLDCSTSSTDLRMGGDENGKLVTQPSYQCTVCPRSFEKRQAFKNHRFMHLKRERRKLKHSPKTKLLDDLSSATNKLPNTTNSEVTSSENTNKMVYLTLPNKVVEKNDEIKVPIKIPSNTSQKATVVKDSKLKYETTNLAVTRISLPHHSSNSGVSSASYACPFCDKVFANKKTCINHKKNHRKKIKSALKITESNFEQVIMDFIRSIRLATEASKSSADQTSSLVKCDNSSFDLRTMINNASINKEREQDCISPFRAMSVQIQTPQKCDIKPFDQFKHLNSSKRLHSTPFVEFNKQKRAKRIPLNQNIVPYEC